MLADRAPVAMLDFPNKKKVDKNFLLKISVYLSTIQLKIG